MENMLISACKKLHFSTNIVENAKQIKGEDNLNFLLKLFTLELENRELKRKNADIKAAKFDVLKTFEDIKIPQSITPTDVLGFRALHFYLYICYNFIK